eukprot:970652_1
MAQHVAISLETAHTGIQHDIYVSYNNHNHHWHPECKNAPTLSSLQRFVFIQFNIKQFALACNDEQGHRFNILEDNHLKKAFKCGKNDVQIFVIDEILRTLPLCQFTTNDICGTLKHSFHNHCNHKTNSAQNHRLKQLMDALHKDIIDGKQMLAFVNEFIQKTAGWSDKEIEQIKSTLFRHWAFTQKEFMNHMDYILSQNHFSKTIIQQITKALHPLDVEQIHFDIKNNKNIRHFSDIVVQLVNEIVALHEESQGDVINSEFVHRLYEAIAMCFIARYEE